MRRGFTLVEILTAVSLFIVVMTVATGAILQVTQANRKTESLKVVMDNLNFALESMSRDIRFGKNYHCGVNGTIAAPQNCPAGDIFLSMLNQNNDQVTYRLTGFQITKTVNGSPAIPVTAPEISITSLNFFVLGANPLPDALQPSVVMKVQGFAGNRADSTSRFTVQTEVSQRAIDR